MEKKLPYRIEIIGVMLTLLSGLLFTTCSPTPTTICSDPVTTAPLQTNLTAYYKFPSSGAQLNDYSGSAFHLTNVGGVTPVVDRAGNAGCAMRFNGINYLETTMSSALSFDSSKPFTLVLSYKPDAAVIPTGIYPILVTQLYPATVVNAALLGYAAASGSEPSLRLDSLKNTFTYTGTFLITPNTNIAANTDWHTVIFSWDGVNTVSLTDYNSTTTVTTTHTASFVALPNCAPGSCPTHTIIGYGFKGIIDDVKFWGRLLTTAELITIKTLDSPCCP